ncbi:NAD(P)H-binding protein [Pseudonocardia nigra]|uniref:NAD(P)H-binding protein n=1 Tax=Pseudonocardia nigra TaxID=1921578 RepID=UPI001C5D9388|nr:NAD(P)H-binding protein [Pseudonocardia nigra]
MTFLVTGATGTIGRRVVEELVRAGHPVRALTRNAAAADLPVGVEVAEGDLTRPETLRPALRGVTALHLLSASGADHVPLESGPDIVDLAAAAGVRRVVVLGTGAEGPVEEAVAASDLEWSRLAPVDYMANTLGWAGSIRTEGVVREPFGGRLTASADEADVAAVVATLLVHGGHPGQTHRLTGPEALTPADKVRAIGAATGRSIEFVELGVAEARAQWLAEGWPAEGVEFMLDMWATVPAEVGVVTTAVEQVTGRPPRSFAQWAAEHADAFRAA